MASTLIVLTPNGRRQTIKVTPNHTILQVLEEACHKHGFKPEEYDLRHHKKVLDPTMTIRFSGLPNNATLELIDAEVTRQEGDVTVAVQLEDGERPMGTFKPHDTVWKVIERLCPKQLISGDLVVVIYMRSEVSGNDALRRTSLRQLGITSGRAMLRLIHREHGASPQQANVSAPLPLKPVEEKPYKRQLISVATPTTTTPTSSAIIPVASNTQPQILSLKAPQNSAQSVTPQPLPMPQYEREQPPPYNRNVNVVDAIKREKRKQTDGIPTKNRTTHQKNQPPTKLEHEDLVFLGDRNAMLFSLETANAVRNDDLPDDFFELSIEDVKKLYRDIKKRRLEMDNQTFKTSAMRQLENDKQQLRNLNKYRKTVIRVQFPNRVVLQGIFQPSETISDVIAFVRDYLEDNKLDIYLFTTPPKTILDASARLIETDCVPNALLHFGCDVKRDNYLKLEVLDKLTSWECSSVHAVNVMMESTRQTSAMISDSDTSLDSFIREDHRPPQATPGTSKAYDDYAYEKPNVAAATSGEKVPKWFKPSK